MLQLHSYTVTCNMLRCNCNMLRCNCNLLQLQVTVTGYSYGVTVIGYSSLNSNQIMHSIVETIRR